MLRDVISVECLGSYQLLVRFDDGVEGVVDVHQTVEATVEASSGGVTSTYLK
jgi:hypothetical protein